MRYYIIIQILLSAASQSFCQCIISSAPECNNEDVFLLTELYYRNETKSTKYFYSLSPIIQIDSGRYLLDGMMNREQTLGMDSNEFCQFNFSLARALVPFSYFELDSLLIQPNEEITLIQRFYLPDLNNRHRTSEYYVNIVFSLFDKPVPIEQWQQVYDRVNSLNLYQELPSDEEHVLKFRLKVRRRLFTGKLVILKLFD